MKKAYSKPVATKIAFSYQEQIVASQEPGTQWEVTCNSGICGHLQTNGCSWQSPGTAGVRVFGIR
mgnify:CR=1 FL=1